MGNTRACTSAEAIERRNKEIVRLSQALRRAVKRANKSGSVKEYEKARVLVELIARNRKLNANLAPNFLGRRKTELPIC